MKPFLLLLLPSLLAAYVDGTVQTLDSGKTAVVISNTGPNGGGTTINIRPGGHVWFSIAGFPQTVGSPATCHDPCSVPINMENGQDSYWHTDSSGLNQSSRLTLPFISAPAQSAPWAMPIPILGFQNYSYAPLSFTIPGGTDVSAIQVYANLFNLRNGLGSVSVNGGPYHQLKQVPVVQVQATGTNLIITTREPHGCTTGQKGQLLGPSSTPQGALGYLYGIYAVTSTGTNTLTVPNSTVPAGYYNWAPPANPTTLQQPNVHAGKFFSCSAFELDETRWNGGMDVLPQSIQFGIPLGASELVAGATNTVTFRHNGTPTDQSFIHGYRVRAVNLVQPWVQISSIAVTSNVATLALASTFTCSTGQAVVYDARGPIGRFNGLRSITTVDSTHVSYSVASVYNTPNGTFVEPSTNDATVAPAPTMWAGCALLPTSDFTAADPAVNYTVSGGNATNGGTWFKTGSLRDRNPWFGSTGAILATCSSCHAADGGDLKYFGFEQRAQYIGSLSRGGSEQNGLDVAAYIAGLSYTRPANGHPWNGLHQPGCAIDSQPVSEWSAGCGDDWRGVLDVDSQEQIENCTTPPASGYWTGCSFASWAYNASPSLNPHQIITNQPMPHWMAILPQIAPVDNAWFWNHGINWNQGLQNGSYQTQVGTLTPGSSTNYAVSNYLTNPNILRNPGDQNIITNATNASPVELTFQWPFNYVTGNTISLTGLFYNDGWGALEGKHTVTVIDSTHLTIALDSTAWGSYPAYCFQNSSCLAISVPPSIETLPGGVNDTGGGYQYPSNYSLGSYASIEWAGVHTWEMLAENVLEGFGDIAHNNSGQYGQAAGPNARVQAQTNRSWMSLVPFGTGPHVAVGGKYYVFNGLDNFDTTAWNLRTAQRYTWARILGSNFRTESGNLAVDMPYYFDFAVFPGNRPGFYNHFLQVAQALQNQLGWNGMTTSQNAVRTVSGSTDTLLNSDSGNMVRYTGTNVAVTLPALGTGGGFQPNWTVLLYHENASGTVTVTSSSTLTGTNTLGPLNSFPGNNAGITAGGVNHYAMSSPGVSGQLMTLNGIWFSSSLAFQLQFNDLFTPDSPEKAAVVTASLNAMLSLIQNSCCNNISEWWDWAVSSPGGTSWITTYNNDGVGFPSMLTYMLAMGNTFGVDHATVLTPIATFFNSVFQLAGHDYTTDAALTCTYSNQPPRVMLNCN